ncbi:hypothetical protein CLCR_04355 [Cladophialophora carrionii]|uniref:Uncharacterized protein n=1 Tax=Cladophialophora carrionii TaxID=86049 RepID=A0A1C1CIT9_9EURO|nr:hypothetical protein CLCR_04355 [Cladophialophora carrionii]
MAAMALTSDFGPHPPGEVKRAVRAVETIRPAIMRQVYPVPDPAGPFASVSHRGVAPSSLPAPYLVASRPVFRFEKDSKPIMNPQLERANDQRLSDQAHLPVSGSPPNKQTRLPLPLATELDWSKLPLRVRGRGSSGRRWSAPTDRLVVPCALQQEREPGRIVGVQGGSLGLIAARTHISPC